MTRLIIGAILLAYYALNVIRLGLIVVSGRIPQQIVASWNLMHGYDPYRPLYHDDKPSIVITALVVWTVIFALPGFLLVFFGWRARKRKSAPPNPAP
jgi:hypothetical protein